ncbi:hypothetical protein Taro_023965 [Colocasia esculenta]|uniref:Uncharacterized protein n=1 Tax=Colocasia esculenta TaxID=4460 RepID=A0A843VD12_COLES|nr:hypothetical protein [Colocasia esculenta]
MVTYEIVMVSMSLQALRNRYGNLQNRYGEQVVASSKEIVTRYGEQVVASSKEIVTMTYRIIVTGKSLRALKKSLR